MARNDPMAMMGEMNRLAVDGWSLWFEAAGVIWLRSMRLAGGGKLAEREAQRMVSEKVLANWELGWKMLAAPLDPPEGRADKAVRHYRSKVRANRRRLAR